MLERALILHGLADGLASSLTSRVFRLSYLALAFLSFTCFTAEQAFLSLLSCALVIFGFLVIASRFLAGVYSSRRMGFKLLGVFLLSFVVSAFLARKYGVVENVQGFVWLSLEFFALYAGFAGGTKGEARRELKLFAAVFVVATFAYAVISLLMGLIGFGYGGSFDSVIPNTGGMYQNRLFGLYADPNYGGVCGVVSIVFSVYLLGFRKTRKYKLLVAANAVVQVSYIALTGSRTALVAGCVAIVVVVAYEAYSRSSKSFGTIVKAALGGLSAAALGMFLFVGSTVFVVFAYDQVEPHVLKAIGGPVSPLEVIFEDGYEERVRDVLEGPSAPEADANDDAQDSVARNPDAQTVHAEQSLAADTSSTSIDKRSLELGAIARSENEDITTGRLGIWESALRVWATAPIFGVSHRNLIDYAEETLPDIYISVEHISTMHNALLDVLASQGVVGITLFGAFLLLSAKRCMRYAALCMRDRKRRAGQGSHLLIGAIAAIVASAMFYSEIVYINTVSSVVFWVALGCLSFLACEEGE